MSKKLASLLTAMFLVFGFSGAVLAENHGEPPVEELEKKFKDWVIQDADEDHKVKNFDSKEEFKSKLAEIMAMDVAEYIVNTWYYEEDGSLYIIPKDGPIFLNMEKDYILEEKGENEYKLTQEAENTLRGRYTLTIQYLKEDGNWIISNRNGVADNEGTGSESGGELPETATSLPMTMMAGAAAMAGGFAILFYRRRSDA
ncbi:LPXTG cell wall anchor domain-containing protein [Bacillus marinisedimentorum]|uniref:LPXTG cell wall anchor domain-containing protein n=1 Tax=Bacillus marinisedimentorum TaxID=1821260 RepID=UPI0007E0E8B4|nr:LPXTG cell wall anchor domain-containing protein [Bacillus marinisedimentorum]